MGRPTEVVYVGIMGMTRTIWVGQEQVWVGHGLPGLIAITGFHGLTQYSNWGLTRVLYRLTIMLVSLYLAVVFKQSRQTSCVYVLYRSHPN